MIGAMINPQPQERASSRPQSSCRSANSATSLVNSERRVAQPGKKACYVCNGANHFADSIICGAATSSKHHRGAHNGKIHAIQKGNFSDSSEEWINSIQANKTSSEVNHITCKLSLTDHKGIHSVSFHVDTGASVNVIHEEYGNKSAMQLPLSTVTSYCKEEIPIIGK